MSGAAVITGFSRGIGRATALRFAARGVDLALLGRGKNQDAEAEVVHECREHGVAAERFACDLADAASIDAAAAALLERFGAPRVVLHNAAILERGPRVHEIPIEVWDRILATNLRGPFVLSRALLPAMLAAGRGRLLFVSSVSGTLPCAEMAHYGASKWGLIGLAKSLAEELRGTGLQALALLPGSVDTDMLKKTPFPPDMSADAVADVAAYYALDAPDAVTGACVDIFG